MDCTILHCSFVANPAAALVPSSSSKVPSLGFRHSRVCLLLPQRQNRLGQRIRASAEATAAAAAAASSDQEELPQKLKGIVDLFAAVPNPREKYQQLMHYAKKLKPLGEEHHNQENKVVGCVSQVWVRAFLDSEGNVHFEADSDSILTKGLAALLVEGLSGSRPQDIVRVSPGFIQMLGLQQSLTPSRSNGFFNMFRLIQQKALQLHMVVDAQGGGGGASSSPAPPAAAAASDAAASGKETKVDLETGNPSSAAQPTSSRRADSIEKKLREALSPSVLQVEDVSHQHAGHAAVRGTTGGETHFNVKVVSPQFEGRSLVKRHRLVYDILDEELKSGLHALSIVAKTPSEVDKR